MPRKPLRVASPDERAPAKPLRVAEAVDADERTFLVSVRAKLANELDNAPAHAVAQLVAKLRDVDKSIRNLDSLADEDVSVVASTDDEPWNDAAH